jgi:hypothetical protein
LSETSVEINRRGIERFFPPHQIHIIKEDFMNRIRLETPIEFHCGTILVLTEEQARPRVEAKQIRALGDEKFEILTSTFFPAGEVVGVDGDVSFYTATTRSVRPKATLIESE